MKYFFLLLKKIYLVIKFFFFVLWEIIIANLRVAHDVITPRLYAKPGVIALPLDCRNDIEITLLATVISLTPGTVSLDVSSNRKYLYIHAMFIDDVELLKNEILKKYEKPILEILR